MIAVRLVLARGTWGMIEAWFVVSKTGLFTGLADSNNQSVELCRTPPDDLDDLILKKKVGSVTTTVTSTLEDTNVKSSGDSNRSSEQVVRTSTLPVVDDALLEEDDAYLSTCCLGTPTFVYLVACVVPRYPDQEDFAYYARRRAALKAPRRASRSAPHRRRE